MSGPFDLLKLPLLGRLLRYRRTRLGLQAASFLFVAAVILDGLCGAQNAAHNLAGHLLWDLVRPLNLLLLVMFGNLFCMTCPFTFVRELAGALQLPSGARTWPARLRTKWTAAALLPLYFWGYLHFGLATSPRRSALLLLAYVVAATLLNSIFRTAVFCKHLCPMGQFNFLVSRLAPLTVQVRSRRTCSSCASHACVQGSATAPGCPMQLYLPQKIGNLDCTLCLRCVQACPNENIQLGAQHPLLDLALDPTRSSLQRLSRRLDLGLLALTVTFAPLLLAARGRIHTGFAALAQHWPALDTAAGSLLLFLLVAAILSLVLTALVKALHRLTPEAAARGLLCRLSGALLPFGVALWFSLLLHAALPTLATAAILAMGLLGSLLPGAAILRDITPALPRTAFSITLWSAALTALYILSLYLLVS